MPGNTAGSIVSTLRPSGLFFAAFALLACFNEPADERGTDGSDSATGGSGATSSVSMSVGTSEVTSSTDGSLSTSSSDDTTTGAGGSSGDTSSGGSTEASSTGSAETGDGAWEGCPLFATSFDGNVLDPLWVESGQPVALANGELELTVTSDGTDGVNTVELIGAWAGDATVTAELGVTPATDRVIQMIRFTTSDTDIVSLRVHHFGGAARLQLFHTVNNLDPQEPFSTDFDPINHAWLRVREEAERLYFEASSDGVTFAPLYDMDDIFDLDGADVSLAANNYPEDLLQDVVVSFSSFEFDCG